MTDIADLKIVSLLPSATEIIAGLGLTDALVGRSHECDYPSAIKDLPVCTKARLNSQKPSCQIDRDVKDLIQQALSIYEIDIETLTKLQPTHIITQDQCDVCAVNLPEVEKAIAQLTNCQPQVISLQPDLLNEVWDDITMVGQTLKVDSTSVLNKLRDRLNYISDKVKDIDTKPTVVAIEWTDPLMVGANWIPELIEIAGGTPLLSVKGKHSPYISWSDLATANPDIIVIMPCGFDLERTAIESQLLTQNLHWKNLTAVKNNKVFITDGNAYFNRPSGRLVDSTEILAEIFYPKLFDYGYKDKSWQQF